MALTLAVADAGDGTGTATLAGSDTASVNTVWYAPFAGVQQLLTWNSAGTRTGDGTLALTQGADNYFWYATGTAGGGPAVSEVIFQALTDQALSVHYRCLQAYQSRVQGLNLPGIGSGANRVVVAWTPSAFQQLAQLPGVLICPVGNEGQPGMLNDQDDIAYPVLVALVDNSPGPQANLDVLTKWRQAIFRAFRHQRLLGVPEIITTDVDTNPVLDPRLYAKNLLYSSLLFKPRSREPRG